MAAHLAEHMADEKLTPREVEVLERVAGGNRNRDIADLLYFSEETVKIHIKHIMDKLPAKDRTEAIAIAVRRGIIQLRSPESGTKSPRSLGIHQIATTAMFGVGAR